MGFNELVAVSVLIGCCADLRGVEEPRTVFAVANPQAGETVDLSGRVSGTAGGVMFWASGGANANVCELLDAQGKPTLSFGCAGEHASIQVPVEAGKVHNFIRNSVWTVPNARPDALNHFAFFWYPDGSARFFVNGLHYPTGFVAGERTKWNIVSNRFAATSQLVFRLKDRKGALRRVEDFRLLDGACANHVAVNAYRARMPLDLVFENSVFAAGKPVRVTAVAAPGGFYTRPKPVDGPDMPATATFALSVDRIVAHVPNPAKPWQIDRRDYLPVAAAARIVGPVRIDRPTDVSAAPAALEPGLHRLVVTVRAEGAEAPFVRTLFFTVAPEVDYTKTPATKESWKALAPFYDKTFRSPDDMELKDAEIRAVKGACGDYLEGNPAGTTRMATVIPCPADSLGKPCLLQIDWPDDKPRSFGLYMYREWIGSNRDRLQGGIQAGCEYPSTDRMQTSEYLFFPSSTNHLFEIRTMVNDWPGAVARVRLSRLAEPLPKLKVHWPEGLEPRRFGHVDEDQSFDTNLNNNLHGGTAGTLDELMRYYAYTGQSTWLYSLTRYTYTYGPVEGSAGNGMFPGRQGEFGAVFGTFKRHGVDFLGRLSLSNVPGVDLLPLRETDLRDAGGVWLDFNGEDYYIYTAGDYQGNLANPRVRKMYFDYFSDFIDRYATNGLAGVSFVNGFGNWHTIELGYDDWTVRRFAEETGHPVPPALLEDAKAKADYNARFAYLAEGAGRTAWLRWRADVVLTFYRELLAVLRRANPEMKILLQLSVTDPEESYEQRGLDLKAIMSLPGVGVSMGRNYTAPRWIQFSGAPESDLNEKYYDAASPQIADLRKRYGAVPLTVSQAVYFETFAKSLDPKRFPAYFEDADVKPWGRYFLKELAFCLGAGDTLAHVIGEQPLGTLGAEEVTREWIQAYSALPALPFTDMSGTTDPIVGRFLETKNGTYFYVVNLHHTDVTAKLGTTVEAQDLSTDLPFRGDAIALKPFQLRSFLVPGGPSSCVTAFRLTAADLKRDCYNARFAELAAAAQAFDAHGLPHGEEDAIVAEAKKTLDEGRLAETHRLLFKRKLNAFLGKLKRFDLVLAEHKMNVAGRYAVNCGCSLYSTIDGKLFSADKEWDGEYGYYGREAATCSRDISTLAKDAPCSELYKTEKYRIDGYRFKVLEPGTYTVKLYLKCGWRNDWWLGHWVTTTTANGKTVAEDFDLYTACKGDFDRPYVMTFDVDVGADRMLDLGFSMKRLLPDGKKSNGTQILVNGIEVERKK